MALPVARLGDVSNHGGTIITASSVGLTANGIAVAVNGDSHSCPITGHGISAITATSKHKSGGRSIVRVNDVAGCGAVITSGSPSVSAN